MIVLTGAAWFAPGAHADFIWRNDWTTSAPSPFNRWSLLQDPMPDSTIAFGANGDAIVAGTPHYQYTQFVRLSSTGALRWATNLSSDFDAPYAVLAAADGGAYFGLSWSGYYYPQTGQLIRVDASGQQMWSRPVFSGWLAQPAPDRIASADCTSLTLLDAASGNVLWQRRISAEVFNCASAGVVADAQGNFYAIADVQVPSLPAGFRTMKFDANGNPIWSVMVPDSQAALIGSSSTMLFEHTASDLRALRKSDGSMAWTIPTASGVGVIVSDDGANDPVVIGPGYARRVAAGTGQQLWNQTVGTPYPATGRAIGGSIVIPSDKITRLDAATGAVISSAVLPTTDSAGNSLQWTDVGPLHEGSFLAVAHPSNSKVGAPPLVLQAINFASGAPTSNVPVPSVPQGMYTTNLADNGGDVVSMGLDYQPNAVNLRLHALNAATGAVVWEHADSIDDLGPGDRFLQSPLQAAFAGSGIATSIALNSDSSPSAVGGSRIALFDRVDGHRRWRTFLHDYDDFQGYTIVSAPIADASGNVFIAESSGAGCGAGGSCNKTSVYKLAATDGSVLWQVDSNSEPPDIMMLGSDVLALGSDYGDKIRRLSGADGSVRWSSSLFANPPLALTAYQVDDGHVVVFGTSSTTNSWAKLDAATGAILWTRSVPRITCTGNVCKPLTIDPVVLPDGDIVTAGGFDINHAPFLRRFRNDGSGVVDEWNPLPNDPAQYTWINRMALDSSGRLRLYLRRGPSKDPPSLLFLAAFDMQTGTLTDQQALVAYTDDPSAQRTYPDLLKQVGADRYVVTTASTRPPQPSTGGIALWDAAVHVRGDLAVATTLDQAYVMPGSNAGFHVKVTYAGDQPLVGATLRASLPWQGGITGLTCTALASTCTTSTASGHVNASFDIQPGGSIDVNGTVKVLDSVAIPALSALVCGPVGLSEQNTRNNFTSTPVSQGLFFDGFESH